MTALWPSSLGETRFAVSDEQNHLQTLRKSDLRFIFAHTCMHNQLGNYNEVSAELNEARETERDREREKTERLGGRVHE